MSEWYGLIAAAFSAIATALAAFATWRSPLKAAQLAERLRREAERDHQRTQRKFDIFTTLMQERSAIYSESGVRALNLIDVAFIESREVREAWSNLFNAFRVWGTLPTLTQETYVRSLLSSIANDIGMIEALRPDDFGRVYVPDILAQERFIRDVERRQALKRLLDSNPQPASTATQAASPWPAAPA